MSKLSVLWFIVTEGLSFALLSLSSKRVRHVAHEWHDGTYAQDDEEGHGRRFPSRPQQSYLIAIAKADFRRFQLGTHQFRTRIPVNTERIAIESGGGGGGTAS